MLLLRFLSISIFLFSANILLGQFNIKGRVNLSDEWEPKIYMAAIKKLSDYYSVSSDMVVSSAPIDSNGYFTLYGDNLPDEKRFYRLYLMKIQNSDFDACLYVGGDDHNFVHILLEDGGQLEIFADPAAIAPFGNYEIQGNQENQLMRNLANIVFPSFYFYRIKYPTELKFSQQKLHIDLMTFVDSCESTPVALAAINNTDFDEYFEEYKSSYKKFGERLKADMPNSIYTQNYFRKLDYYLDEKPLPNWAAVLLGILLLTVISLLFFIKKLNARIAELEIASSTNPSSNNTPPISIDEILTQKEKEIFQLISEGKSNKEIAASLFVELSTIKSHINKIYSKLGVTNRKEATQLAKKLVNNE